MVCCYFAVVVLGIAVVGGGGVVVWGVVVVVVDDDVVVVVVRDWLRFANAYFIFTAKKPMNSIYLDTNDGRIWTGNSVRSMQVSKNIQGSILYQHYLIVLQLFDKYFILKQWS